MTRFVPCLLWTMFVLFSLLSATQAIAADWVGATGDFNEDGNWSTGSVPNSAQEAVINNGGVAQFISGDTNVASLLIGRNGGSGDFEQTGGNFGANGAFIGVNSLGNAQISEGEFAIGGDSIHVGWQPAGVGELTIDGAGALVTSGDDFQLGREGVGTLNFAAGQLRAGFTVIGKFGAGIWNQSGGLFDQDFGDIEIGDGGRDDEAGTPGPRTGIMEFTGGFIQTAGHLAIGNRRGSGTVNISSGALAATGGTSSNIYIGRGADSSPGSGGDTALRVTGADATIIANGSLIMNSENVSPSSTLITEITGPTHTPIKVVGDANIGNGNLKIELNGYSPMANDAWMLIQTGSDLADDIQRIELELDEAGYEPLTHEDPEFQGQVVGEFAGIDDSLAPLPPGLSWNVGYTQTQVFLGVTGTPSLIGDFDGNGVLNTIDIDLLMNEVAAGTNDSAFDITNDGAVDDMDRDQWLAEAGPSNGFSDSFLVGDANLDGMVAAGDLNEVGLTWQSDNNNWSNGNFTGGGTNAADLNAMALNWQDSVPLAGAQAVPEPSSFVLALSLAVGLLLQLRRK